MKLRKHCSPPYVWEAEKIEEFGFLAVRLRRLPDETLSPEKMLARKELREEVERILKTLSPREEQIIRRVIMKDEDPEEVGEHFCLTGSRIWQIKAKALRKLRHPSKSIRLHAFLGA